MLRIEVIDDARAELGEGPLWDVAEQRLYWIDSLGAKVHSWNAAGGERRAWSVPEHIGSLALREGGGAILSLRDGFYTLDFGTGACCKLVDPDPGKPRIRMNDGKVDRQGRFVAGYMDYEESYPLCSVFRLDPGETVTALDSGIVCSTGRAGVPTGEHSISRTRPPRTSGPTTMISPPARPAIAAPSAPFRPSASKACPTAPRSMLTASSGACRSMRESWCASRRTDGPTPGLDCPSRARRVLSSAALTSTSPM